MSGARRSPEFLFKLVFVNSCPMNMKLNQSGQDMSLPVVIKSGRNPGSNKKVTFKLPFWVISSLIGNVPFFIKMVVGNTVN